MKNKKLLWILGGITVFACSICMIGMAVAFMSLPTDMEVVGDKYLTAVQNQDYAEAVRWTHPVSNMTEDVLAEFFAGMNITDWSFTSYNVDGATATLDGNIVVNGAERPVHLFLYYAEEDWWVVSITVSP